MRQDTYDTSYDLENRYWWYLGRRYVLDKLLARFFPLDHKKIVDIGCGTGGNFPMLEKYGQVLGLDIEPRALEFCRGKGFETVALMKGQYDTGLSDQFADLVTMFDVLEHFEDDARALAEMSRILKSGGYFLLNVPAFKFLWSELDDAVYHKRRYRRAELEDKLQQAGLSPVKSTYLFFFVFPLVFFYRLIGQFRERRLHPQFTYVEFPGFIAWILVGLSKCEAWLLQFVNFPVGSSVTILARKK